MSSLNGKPKIFLLGIDGAAFRFVDRWSDEGLMPAFERIKREGCFGVLKSLPVPNSAAAWSSIVTGANPGKHGLIDFFVPIADTYDISFLCGKDRRLPAFWQLSPHHRFIVVNVPMTYPADAINGEMICGVDAPGIGSKGFCHPPNLLREIQKAVGPYILQPGVMGHFIAGQIDEVIAKLYDMVQRRLDTVKYLMRNRDWDCFMAVFSVVDSVQHCFWRYFDTEHPQYDATEARKYGRVIPEFYQRVDNVLGEIMQELPEECLLIVMSDHGFGPKHTATYQLTDWLRSLGLLRYTDKRSAGRLHKRLLRQLYMTVERRLTRQSKERLVRMMPKVRDRIRSRMAYSDIDWSRTKVYADNVSPSLRINLRGREPLGIVEPGEEYERVVREVTESLLSLRADDEDRSPLISAVQRSRDIYEGSYASLAPDLFILWNDKFAVERIHRDLPPPVPATGEFRVITGDHHPDGIIGMWGPGKVTAGKSIHSTLYDLAPTVLAWLGKGSFPEMEGHILNEAFEEPIAVTRDEAVEQTGMQDAESGVPALTSEDEKVLRDRLRGLGYVE